MERRERRHMRPAQPVPRRLPVRHDPAVIADLRSDALARQRTRPPAPVPKAEILPPDSGLAVRFAPEIFRRSDDRFVEVPHGLSLAEIVDHLVGEPPLPREYADVYLDGVVIPPDWWPRLRPKPAARVKVVLVPGGGSDTLRMALTAAVVVAAAAAVVATGGTALAAYGPLIGAGIPLAGPLVVGGEP